METGRVSTQETAGNGGVPRPLRVLLVENVAAEAELCVAELRHAGYALEVNIVATREELGAQLAQKQYDLVLSDYNLGGWTGEVVPRDIRERGLNIRPMPGSWMREQPYVTAGVGSLGVLNQPPHPNALKVYLNWLLGPDGQLAFSKSTGFASYRRDVPRDHVHDFLILREGIEYDHTHKESAQWREEETVTFLRGLVPS